MIYNIITKITMKLMIVLLLLTAIASCGPKNMHPELKTVSFVDLKRYQGTWHEIARLPMWFQRKCVRSKAEYRLDDSGRVAVTNSCITKKGDQLVATGHATVVDTKTNAKLEILFDNWFSKLFPWLTKGKYWVLYLDTEYTVAIVGNPNRKYLWILSRKPAIPQENYNELVKICRKRGFETQKLIKAPGE